MTMPHMPVKASPDLAATPGDFGVRLNDAHDALEVPEDVLNILTGMGLCNVCEFAGGAICFPSSFAGQLKWKREDALEAAEKLEAYLVAEGVIDPFQRNFPPPGYGALPPRP